MTKIRNITRLILACFTAIASISLLTAVIYFMADYERNTLLNSNIDDFTIGFMIVALILFSGVSILLFISVFNKKKIENEIN